MRPVSGREAPHVVLFSGEYTILALTKCRIPSHAHVSVRKNHIRTWVTTRMSSEALFPLRGATCQQARVEIDWSSGASAGT